MGYRYYKQIKFKGIINSFDNEYEYMSLDHISSFTYMGENYQTINEAYTAMKNLYKDKINSLKVMQEIIYSKYVHNLDLKEKLMATEDIWIALQVKDHDNYWHNCTCSECFLEQGENYYGRILMEIRDKFIYDRSKERKYTHRKWIPKYF